jgi:hypothetical protein
LAKVFHKITQDSPRGLRFLHQTRFRHPKHSPPRDVADRTPIDVGGQRLARECDCHIAEGSNATVGDSAALDRVGVFRQLVDAGKPSTLLCLYDREVFIAGPDFDVGYPVLSPMLLQGDTAVRDSRWTSDRGKETRAQFRGVLERKTESRSHCILVGDKQIEHGSYVTAVGFEAQANVLGTNLSNVQVLLQAHPIIASETSFRTVIDSSNVC